MRRGCEAHRRRFPGAATPRGRPQDSVNAARRPQTGAVIATPSAQPAPGVTPGPDLEERLIAYVRERIAHYKAPRSVDFVDELPRTLTGKLAKGELQARYAHPGPA